MAARQGTVLDLFEGIDGVGEDVDNVEAGANAPDDNNGGGGAAEAAGLATVLGSLQALWQQGCHDVSRLAWGIRARRAALDAMGAELASAAAASIQEPARLSLLPHHDGGAGAAAAAAAVAAQAPHAAPLVRQRGAPLAVTDPDAAMSGYRSLSRQVADRRAVTAAAAAASSAAAAALTGEGGGPKGGEEAQWVLNLRLVDRSEALVGDEYVVTARLEPLLAAAANSSGGGGGSLIENEGSGNAVCWRAAALRVTHAALLAWAAGAPVSARSVWRYDAAAAALIVEVAVPLSQLLPLAAAAAAAAAAGSAADAAQHPIQQQQEEEGSYTEDDEYGEIVDGLAAAAEAECGIVSGGAAATDSASGFSALLELGVVASAELVPAAAECQGGGGAAVAGSGVLLLRPARMPLGGWAARRLNAAPPSSSSAAAGEGQAPLVQHSLQQQQQQRRTQQQRTQGKSYDDDDVIEESQPLGPSSVVPATAGDSKPPAAAAAAAADAGTAAAAPAAATGLHPCFECEEHFVLQTSGGAALAQLPLVLAREFGLRARGDGSSEEQLQLQAACDAAQAGRRVRVALLSPPPGEPAGAAAPEVELLLQGAGAGEAALRGASDGAVRLLHAALLEAAALLERRCCQQSGGSGGGGGARPCITVRPNPASGAALADVAGAVQALDDALALHCAAIEAALARAGGGDSWREAPADAAAGARGQQLLLQHGYGGAAKRGAGGGGGGDGGKAAIALVPSGSPKRDAQWLACLLAQAHLDAAVAALAASAAPRAAPS